MGMARHCAGPLAGKTARSPVPIRSHRRRRYLNLGRCRRRRRSPARHLRLRPAPPPPRHLQVRPAAAPTPTPTAPAASPRTPAPPAPAVAAAHSAPPAPAVAAAHRSPADPAGGAPTPAPGPAPDDSVRPRSPVRATAASSLAPQHARRRRPPRPAPTAACRPRSAGPSARRRLPKARSPTTPRVRTAQISRAATQGYDKSTLGTGRSRSRARPPLTAASAAASFAGRLRRGSTDAPSYSRAAYPLDHLIISLPGMFRPPNAFGAPSPFPPQPQPQPWQWQQPPPPWPSPSPAVTFWQRDNVRDHVRKLQQTIELSTALIKELEELAAARNSGDAAMQESASSSAELPPGSGDSSEDMPLRFVELARSMGISQDTHESMATDAANYLCHQLQHLLGPISSVTSQSGPWEERSAMVRVTQKLQKYKRNKRWRQRRRKHVAELFQKERADYDRIDQEADEWRAKQIAKDIAKRKVESMQQIARKKANEERKHLESELELALMVEKLQELRSIRVQKMKKQGHFLPEEDDKYLERVKAAVEEEERQAASAARTDAVKDAILTAEESRKPPQNANSQEGGSEQPSGPSEDKDLGDGGINERNDQASQKTEHEDEGHRFEGKGHEHHDPVSSLPFEFYHYYHGSSYDMGTLIEVRRMWDSFIRPGGSRIPGHWVQPPPPADEVWASYLVQPK